MRLRKYAACLLLCLTLACSSIKIDTGTTTEEMADKNEIQAKQMRGEWADKLRAVPNDGRRAYLVKVYIDSVSSIIARYGIRVADEWKRGNAGRGEPIQDTEMRQVVNAWVGSQRPILRAYEDNIEYGIKLVRESKIVGVLTEEAYDFFDSLANQYYNTHSSVFYPNHNVEVYEEELEKAQSRYQYFSEKLGAYFRRY